MCFTIETELEEDGRWIAEVTELPGVLAYGASREQAIAHVEALALRVLADKIEHGEEVPGVASVFAVAARVSGRPPAPKLFWPPCFASAGTPSASRARTARWSAKAGPITCSPSTTATRSGRGCWRASPRAPASRQATCRARRKYLWRFGHNEVA